MEIITGITVQHQIVHQALRYRIIAHQQEVLQQIVHQPVSRKDLLLRHVLQPQTVSQKVHQLRPGLQHQITHPDRNQTTLPDPDQVLRRLPDPVTPQVPDQ